ncbi:MAG TPA: lamin tail domain-containing protein [Anaerohalosphaeraceae bacterium]|nr:lamin tail domain-containing protein [Anaerohalosphaeraceae bacterium]HRT51555.1 lamin tail domain-containing protein [Anaerohalosphaeraceae bacterium]
MSVNVWILTCALAVMAALSGGQVRSDCPSADLSSDCAVDIIDLGFFAFQWLDIPGGSANLDGTPGVTFGDFAVLASQWRTRGEPVTLVINEFMADNNCFFFDSAGDDDDWIEIYNYGPEPVDLGGMFVTDDLDEPTKCQIPMGMRAETTVPAGGFLILWADNEELPEDPLHLSFALAAGGDEDIALFDRNGRLVDSILNYGPQEENASYGRMPDAGEQWQVFAATSQTPPTPGQNNGGRPPEDEILITEIMYHPFNAAHPLVEDIGEEYIEIHNPGPAAVSLAGWRFTDGVDFTFPAVTIGPGQYLVVASDTVKFAAKYPNVTNVVGGWDGRLSNSGETIELTNAAGRVIDRIAYADEGDWAQRMKGPLDHGHRGWTWSDAHDGGGYSLELVNVARPNEYGQNWMAGMVIGGTPGAANSVASVESAPFIVDVRHMPIIPRASDPVTVSARIVDSAPAGLTVTAHYRRDGQPSFTAAGMHDDGSADDALPNDGIYAATLPPQPHGTIVEFYVRVQDSAGRVRTWPAPSDVDGTLQQVTNMLYQVDDAFDPRALWTPGRVPVLHLIMTEAERAELADIGDSSVDSYPHPIYPNDDDECDSNAQMNATFISIDGVEMQVHYNTGVRNRGNRSRSNPPMSYHVRFRRDDPYNGVTALNINSKYPFNQVMGSLMFRLAGTAAPETVPVEVRINGQNLAQTGSSMYGLYAMLEVYDSDYAENHFPDDPDGNLYRCTYDERWGGRTVADLTYKGTDPADYAENYVKQTNESEYDYADIFDLTYTLNDVGIVEADYAAEVGRLADIGQWMAFMATDTLMGNIEGGLTTGSGDDYAMYRGLIDTRFRLLPHDLDTLFNEGDHGIALDRSIFSFEDTNGLGRLMNNSDAIGMYFRSLLNQCDTIFAPETFDPLVQQVLGGWTPQGLIDDIKDFMAARRAYVTDPAEEIPQDALSVSSALSVVSGYPRTSTSSFSLTGTAPAVEVGSVLVNGRPAEWLLREGTWSYGGAAGTGRSEVIVAAGSRWRYLDNGNDQGTAWRQVGFDDSGWREGAAELGYGDGDESPDGEVDDGDGFGPYGRRYVTTYFRHTFEVADPSKYVGLELKLIRDDGACVYLNGTEIARTNLPGTPGDGAINYLTRANSAIGGTDEETWYSWYPDAQLLQTGTNVIAAEVHQYSSSSTTPVTSSDMSFNLELIGYEPSGEDDLLMPGVNRVVVQAMEGKDGVGAEVDRRHIDLWYDDGDMTPVSGILEGSPVPSGTLVMTMRDSFLPGVPVLVRVEIVDDDGTIKRDVWNATANLSVAGNPAIKLSVSQITLYNGMGSALVTFTGAGDFTLQAEVLGLEAATSLIDLTGQPITMVSGGISTSQTWSGIYHITGGDFSIASGATLTLEPGTLVMLDGTASGSGGLDIDVQGAIRSMGTANAPVTFTAAVAGQNWGEIHFDNAADSTFTWTNITQAGYSPGVGHSGSGPTIRGAGTKLVFDHCNITDNAGKAMHLTGGCDLTFTNGMMGRCVMGPEISGTALWCENTWFVDMHGDDDADGIYVHDQQAGQLCKMLTGVIAGIDDDGLDTLGADITIEDYIIRDIKDKGISVNAGETTIKRCLVVETNLAPEDPTVAAIAAKVGEGATAVVRMDRSTVVATRTDGVVDYGIQSHDKYGINAGTVIWHVTNSIIDATDPIAVDDPPYSTFDMHVDFSNAWDEVWPGTGNIHADPLFVNAGAHDYRLQPASPCIDAGDPAQTDPDGSRVDMGCLPYEAPATDQETILIWTAQEGPYRVSGTATVPAGLTLKIMPGTSVFFDAGASLVVNGRLVAEGTLYRPIRFTRTPGDAGTWNGIQFIDTMQDNRIRHAIVEYGVTDNGMVGTTNSSLLLEHVTFDHTGRRRLRTENSSLIVSRCTFTDMFGPGEPPLTDNLSEHIWGGGVPAEGHFIIENNVFGTTKGHNDAIDIDGFARPNPIPQILNNVFLGGGDDALDIECDIHIEGNVFMHFHKDQYNTASGEGNVISAGGGKEYTVVRNVFYDVDHVAQIKDGAFMNFVNNTVSHVTASALYFDLPGRTPGRGAYVEGSIFDDTVLVFDAVAPTTELTVHRSLVNESEMALGQGNITGSAFLADPAGGDFSLLSRSPAKGAGSHGLDMGAKVPLLSIVSGLPRPITHRTDATLRVFGPGMTHYKYRLNDGPWSGEQTIDVPIMLAGLADGRTYTLYVLGKNTAGQWQAEEDALASRPWTIDTLHQTLIINEVLAQTRTFDSDMIELYYDGPAPLDLEGMHISDDRGNPTKATFAAGTVMMPDSFLVLRADNGNLGFSLSGDGEDVYLYDKGGMLIDSVEFGRQVPDMSIGRLDDGTWALNLPTFGHANKAAVIGEQRLSKINEWLASGEVLYTDDFIELYNPDDLPVALDGVYITDDPVNGKTKHGFGPLNFVPARSFVTFVADGGNEPGCVNFRLSAKHEVLALYDADLAEIDKVVFYAQTTDVSQGRAPDGARTLAFYTTPTPGAANVDIVVISEVLAHSHAEAADWIELLNTSDAPVDIGGWFLSDSWNNLRKYEIPAPRVLQPGEYAVFYEDQHFGNAAAPGTHAAFGLSENGECVILTAASAGVFTGYQRQVDFGASATGIAFGRYETSTGVIHFVPMSRNTPGGANEGPKVGPIVISEIMYNPGDTETEYIELLNISAASVTLQEYDNVPGRDVPWRLTNGVDYIFPAGTTIAAGERILVVKNAAAFAARYPMVPAQTKVFTWTWGQLDNNGETVEIALPGDEDDGERLYISVDSVRYDNRAGWPKEADGTGRSLTRIDTAAYGNDCSNWKSAQPTPGW